MGKLIFSTAGVEPRHRVDLWRSTLADLLAPVEISDFEPGGFEAEVVSTSVGDLTLVQSVSGPQTFERQPSRIGKAPRHDYVVSIQLGRTISYATAGHEMTMARDSVTLFDIARHHCCRAVDGVNVLDIQIPRAVFDLAFGPSADAVGLTIGPDHPSNPLIRAFFRSVMDQAEGFDRSTSRRMETIGIDLLTASFADLLGRRVQAETSADTVVYRAKVFMEDHLGDPGLDAGTIAASVGVPLDHLHEFFSARDLTVDGYLFDRRLARARKQLCDPAYDGLSTADIAGGAGFPGAAHFARAFRQRFGVTPSDLRARARWEHAAHAGRMH